MACKICLYEMKEEDVHTHKAASLEPSCVSVKSDRSMGIPPLLSNESVTSVPKVRIGNMSRPVTPLVSRPVSYCQNLFRKNNKKTALQTNTQETNMEHISLQRVHDCSAIAYMLQISEEVLDEFDLRKYNTSDEGRSRLIPAVVNCRKALLADCNLTGQCSESLFSSLHSSNSLRELDLSNNDLQDSGVKLLPHGLKSSHCQLNILRLACCNLTGQCCKSLSSCLQSSNSLRELDLSNNDLQDSGVKLLCDGLKSSYCQLNILRLSGCMVTEEGCCFLASALSSNPSHLRELDLSYNHPGQSLFKLLSDPNYRLENLNVDHGGEFRITAGLQK
ncbi:hypothetical protein QQF64_023941, partial [Cirrhinus molitorella]